MQVLDRDEESGNQLPTFKSKLVLYWLIPLLIGLLLRFFLSYQPAGFLIVFSSAVITAYSWHHWIYLRGRDLMNNIIGILALIWLVIFIWGAYYNHGYPYNRYALRFNGVLIIGSFAVFEIIKRRQNGRQ